MTDQESLRKLFTYGWLLTPDRMSSVFLPLHEEDTGKVETAGDLGWTTFGPGMLGIISGGVEEYETALMAIIREAEEEQGISVPFENVTNGYPQVLGSQLRGGSQIDFRGVGHRMVLTEGNLAYIKSQHAERQQKIEEVPHTSLENFFLANKSKFRPFIVVAGWEIIKLNLLALENLKV